MRDTQFVSRGVRGISQRTIHGPARAKHSRGRAPCRLPPIGYDAGAARASPVTSPSLSPGRPGGYAHCIFPAQASTGEPWRRIKRRIRFAADTHDSACRLWLPCVAPGSAWQGCRRRSGIGRPIGSLWRRRAWAHAASRPPWSRAHCRTHIYTTLTAPKACLPHMFRDYKFA